MSNRSELLRKIQMCDFAMTDAALFLDVNPGDAAALAFYRKHQEMRKAYADEYIPQYGPIDMTDYDGGERWKWIDAPWPWQNEEE